MKQYPSSLPLPTYGSEINFVPMSRRSSPQSSGPVEQYKDGGTFVWQLRVSWIFLPDEMQAFKEWYTTELNNGILPFSMTYVWGTDMVFEFSDDAYELSASGYNRYTVSANMRTYESPPLENLQDYAMDFTAPIPNLGAVHGEVFSKQCDVEGTRTGPVVFDAWDSTDLPPWMTLSQSGLMSGTAPLLGRFRFITNPMLPNAYFGESYTAGVVAALGTVPYTYTFQSGGLPPGVSFTGLVVTGTVPTKPLSIAGSGVVTVGAFRVVRRRLVPAGGKKTFSFALAPGSNPLPSGISLSSDGVLSGVAAKHTGKPLQILNTSPLPMALKTRTYFMKVRTFGGTGDSTFSLLSGSLPTGLTLNANGNITGTP